MFYLNVGTKGSTAVAGLRFGGGKPDTGVLCCETEALMRRVGQMVGAGGAHWALCVDATIRPLLDSPAPT